MSLKMEEELGLLTVRRLGQGRASAQALQEEGLPGFPLVRTEAFPGSHAIPAPAPCPLFPLPPARPVNSAALPFTRPRRLSMGSAGPGGRRPVARQRPKRRRTLPPGPGHIRTSPSAPRACGLISSPPLLELAQRLQLQCGHGPALNYAPGHSSGQSLCRLGCSLPVPELRACHTLAEALHERGRVVPLPPSAASTHLPPLFLSAGGQALVCLLAGMRSLRRRSRAFLPTRFLLSQAKRRI